MASDHDLNQILGIKRFLVNYEVDAAVRLVILTGMGKAFCAGGDIFTLLKLTDAEQGDLRHLINFLGGKLLLHYVIAKYRKPLVIVMDGITFGGGAALSMNGSFRIATENTVFALPEPHLGLPHDVGVCYFLSGLPAHFGEYLGLTGARINGAEMLQCGLATHFLLSKDLESLENELCDEGTSTDAFVTNALQKYLHHPKLNQDSACARLDIINKCFSKETVEEILSSLKNEVESCGDKWMIGAINSINHASPTCLKICLKSIREGRSLTMEACLMRDCTIIRNMIRRRHGSDLIEGLRARFHIKDNNKKPQWEPPQLEDVSNEFVKQLFTNIQNDDDLDSLDPPERKFIIEKIMRYSRL